jgi:radical SAM protein with 4Fe4S-binding SPASM domain
MELLTDVTLFKHKLWAEEYAYRMEEWNKGKKLGPIRIDAELHTRCNLNCRICDRRNSIYDKLSEEERAKMEMPAVKWVKIAEESGKMGVKAWNISGLCEPLAKPDVLFPTMRMIKAYDMFGELTTNGTLWNEKYIRETIEMGWDSVCISIDAPDSQTHDWLRGMKGTFKKACATLKTFSQMKKRYKTSLPVLTINMVLNKVNYLKLVDMVRVANELGADAIFIEPMVIFTEEGKKLKMEEKEIGKFREVVREAKKLSEKYGIVLDVTAIAPGGFFSAEKRFDKALIEKAGNIRDVLIQEAKSYSDPILSIPCYYPWFCLMIRSNGSVVHCGEWKGEMENIREKTLEEVWFGKILSDIREQFKKGILPKECEKCRPNVVEDTRIVRKSIKEFRDIDWLRGKYFEFLEENKRLKQELFALKRKKYKDDRKCLECKYRKEIEKFKNSLTFKIFSKFWNTKIEKILKKK